MKHRYSDYGKSIAVGAIIGVLLAVAFAAGFFLRDTMTLTQFTGAAENTYPLLGEVQALLESHYLRELPSETEQQYAAIRGLLARLDDRNTFFIEPPVAQSESDALAGTYGGIGVQLRRSPEGAFLLTPFADSPAAAVGIRDGDQLLAVDGLSIDLTMQQDAVDQMMRGEVGDGHGVSVTVQFHDEPERTVFIAFDVINVPSVLWRELEEDSSIGYIQMLRFTSRTPDEVEEAADALAARDVSALVLDLRGNSGGLLQEALDVADLFIDDGVLLYERTNSDERSYDAQPGSIMSDLPLVVLVNAGTASAAELLAGAIADRERGILIGQRTYGKGTIQQIFALSDQSSVHITSAEWLTPERFALDGQGLEPTINMIPDENGRDVELGEALRYLQGARASTNE